MRLIDADALLGRYDRIHVGAPGKARKLIEDAPTIDTIPVVHGWWNTAVRNEAKREVTVECSHCGAVFTEPMFAFMLNYNYCPNCGAKMDGEEK